jgi:hypothetical protein
MAVIAGVGCCTSLPYGTGRFASPVRDRRVVPHSWPSQGAMRIVAGLAVKLGLDIQCPVRFLAVPQGKYSPGEAERLVIR